MKTFTREYRLEPYHSPIFDEYFGDARGCVFDIETTGLSSEYSRGKVILTAMLIPTERGIAITQYLAEDPFEEDRVLRETAAFFIRNRIDYVITYNGASFDIPFMNRRFEALREPYALNLYNLDLYPFLKRFSILPERLSSLSQKSVERYFGIGQDRRDTISGKESVKLYYEYIADQNPVLEKVILTHNREDVLQLYRILKVAGYEDFRDILRKEDLHAALSSYGLPCVLSASEPEGPAEPEGKKAAALPLSITPKVLSKALRLRGRQFAAPWQMASYDEDIVNAGKRGLLLNASIFRDMKSPAEASFRSATGDYEISLPLEAHGRARYINIQELSPLLSPKQPAAEAFRDLPNRIGSYLILTDDAGTPLHREINRLSEVLAASLYLAARRLDA